MRNADQEGAEFSVRPETSPDFIETARLANEAFETGGSGFTPERLQWLYEHAFSAGAQVLALFAGERKVGQVALVHQLVDVGRKEERAVALMDLFILQAFRSRDAIATLYGEVQRFCLREGTRFILAVPNEKAAGVNKRFLQLEPHLTLDLRVGVAWVVAGGGVRSTAVTALDRTAGLSWLEPFVPGEATGLRWTDESLWERLQDPAARFGLHATANLLLISSRRRSKRLTHTLLCAFFPRPGAAVARGEVAALTAAACRFQRRPAFVYAGVNTPVPLPGWPLPGRLRPSPMVLQLRDFGPTSNRVRFDRFETIDFDFA